MSQVPYRLRYVAQLFKGKKLDKGKKLKCRLLQFLFGAVRVKIEAFGLKFKFTDLQYNKSLCCV